MLFNTSVEDMIVKKGVNWLVDICEKHDIQTEAGVVDIGVRYELADEVMKETLKSATAGDITFAIVI